MNVITITILGSSIYLISRIIIDNLSKRYKLRKKGKAYSIKRINKDSIHIVSIK